MKKLIRFLSLLATLTLFACCAAAEGNEEDSTVALVNGEALTASAYTPMEEQYLTQYAAMGYDVTDEAAKAFVQDLALTAAIEQMLVKQDMAAQGCYDFEADVESWCQEQGQAAYEAALQNVGDVLRTTLELGEDEDMSQYAKNYAQVLGVTAQDYINVYRTQVATESYNAWLTQDCPVTDEDVQSAYDERVANDQARFEQDVPAFESAIGSGEQTWYKPAGYRSILQILLPAEGETEADKLAAASAQTQEIAKRLDAGESFASLIAEYGVDSAFDDASFYETGYQVHADSILWDEAFVNAAFSQDLQKPGDWGEPFASDLGVHILYYLADSESGPVEMTDTLHDALAYTLYSERCHARMEARIEELAAAAEVTLY